MANFTTHKNLELPVNPEHYNVNVFNKNAMVIDSELHKLDIKNQSQDNLLATKESLNSEISRATTKENEISSNLASEISRAKSAETKNANNLSDEITRAIIAEESINNSLQNHIADESNPHNVNKTHVGLKNVDNTSDMDKPVSIAQQNALDAAFMQSNYYTDVKIAELIDGAPTTLDTLKEIADAMAENENVVNALEAAIGTRANETEFQAHAGNETIHITASEKEKINEIDAIKQSFQDGCSAIAGKITACGIDTASNASPEVIAENIQQLYNSRYTAGANASKVGTATADKVLSGCSFTNAYGVGIDGTMPDRSAVSQTLNCGGRYTIPEGYHNGNGKVTANTLASQTQATATAANITKDKTAYVNGIKVTGTGSDNTTNYNNGYNAGVTAADARVNTTSANYKSGYNAGVSAADGRVNTASQSYIQGYNAGVTAGVASAQKTLQVRAKAHISGGVQYFYVRIYNGNTLLFDQGSNDNQSKDSAGYVTINNFTV